MLKLPKIVVKELDSFCEEQYILIEEYELSESFEMAYLAKWTICETFIKQVYLVNAQHKKFELMNSWVSYYKLFFDNKTVGIKKPKSNSIGIIPQSQITLPKYSEIKKLFKGCESLLLAFNSQGKYRNKRNDIAHRAVRLSKALYDSDYSNVLDKSIKELQEFLSKNRAL